MIRSYYELACIGTFEERYQYLKLQGVVGNSTFGFGRHFNQMLYRSRRWRSVREQVIIRDEARDLGCEGFDIHDQIVVHHMNPITYEDIMENRDHVFDARYLICTTHSTHMAIHYGDASLLPVLPEARKPGDTTPWK